MLEPLGKVRWKLHTQCAANKSSYLLLHILYALMYLCLFVPLCLYKSMPLPLQLYASVLAMLLYGYAICWYYSTPLQLCASIFLLPICASMHPHFCLCASAARSLSFFNVSTKLFLNASVPQWIRRCTDIHPSFSFFYASTPLHLFLCTSASSTALCLDAYGINMMHIGIHIIC